MPTPELIGLPVEVSGWDADGRFFVEHAALDSPESGQKTLLLRHTVHTRSLVFVRALYTDAFTEPHPQAHQVDRMEGSERSGYHRLHLADFPPRRHGGYEPKDPVKASYRCAREVKS